VGKADLERRRPCATAFRGGFVASAVLGSRNLLRSIASSSDSLLRSGDPTYCAVTFPRRGPAIAGRSSSPIVFSGTDDRDQGPRMELAFGN